MTHRKLKLDHKGEPIWEKGDKYVSWSTYSEKDIGRLTAFALSHWRGVLLSISPSQELLTVKVYSDDGQRSFYGRTLWEIYGRLYKEKNVYRDPEELYVPRPVTQRSSASGDSDPVLDTAAGEALESWEAFWLRKRQEEEHNRALLREDLRKRFPNGYRRR